MSHLLVASSLLGSYTVPMHVNLILLKFKTPYLVSFSNPNQRALAVMHCISSFEIEGFYTVTLMFVTNL